MAGSSKVSLRQISEEAGVTRMAVSLALRGKAGVSEATRKKIFQVAEKLGYEPDPELGKLMAHIRSRSAAETKACLALLTFGTSPDHWKKSTTERLYVEGAEARAKEFGYRVEFFWMNQPDLSPKRLSNILWNRGIEGVILTPLQGSLSNYPGRAVELDFSRFSSVEIGETIDSPNLDRAIHDQYTSMQKLLRELTALNYKRIGLVLSYALDSRVNGKWTGAYLQHHLESKGKRLPPLLLDTPSQKNFDAWYDKHQPDAIISIVHLGIDYLRSRGIQIPKTVGYASLDVDGDSKHLKDVSGIDQNSRQVGAAAVDMLVASIQRNQRGVPEHPRRIQIEGTWKSGTSTRNR